eukprot:scaffold28.g7547.t1
MAADSGVFVSTAGTYMSSKEELDDHYRSDFHRRAYNLKRKIAGLPPVTREWYEARKAQLLASAAAPVQRIWFDPLTKKKFGSENTYLAYTRSKKYAELVKKSGQLAPAAVVTLRRVESGGAAADGPSTSGRGGGGATPSAAPAARERPAGYVAKPAAWGGAASVEAEGGGGGGGGREEEAEAEEVDEGSEWETASEEEMGEADQAWEEWDLRRSLFDNHVSGSFEANLEYIFGFYFPDADCLSDPEGLLRYLGAKLQYGHVPLYAAGDDARARAFSSLHGVQRHMVDTGRCKMLYDGNEEEYEDFYDYSAMEEDGGEAGTAGALVVADALAGGGGAAAGYELVLPSPSGAPGGGKILGAREFARYYRQRHRGGGEPAGGAAARVLAQYRRLAVPLLGNGSAEEAVEKRQARRARARWQKEQLRMQMRRNVNDNLPKNVPY